MGKGEVVKGWDMIIQAKPILYCSNLNIMLALSSHLEKAVNQIECVVFSGGGGGRDLVENNRLLHQVEAGPSKERGFFLK